MVDTYSFMWRSHKTTFVTYSLIKYYYIINEDKKLKYSNQIRRFWNPNSGISF